MLATPPRENEHAGGEPIPEKLYALALNDIERTAFETDRCRMILRADYPSRGWTWKPIHGISQADFVEGTAAIVKDLRARRTCVDKRSMTLRPRCSIYERVNPFDRKEREFLIFFCLV